MFDTVSVMVKSLLTLDSTIVSLWKDPSVQVMLQEGVQTVTEDNKKQYVECLERWRLHEGRRRRVSRLLKLWSAWLVKSGTKQSCLISQRKSTTKNCRARKEWYMNSGLVRGWKVSNYLICTWCHPYVFMKWADGWWFWAAPAGQDYLH